MKRKMKPLSELNLLDRFLFACAMEDKWILQQVLEIILGREVVLSDRTNVEKEFRTIPQFRSVRLDVVGYDTDDGMYNTEVQNRNTGNMVKRSRFYQALMDSSVLKSGEEDFNKMPSSYQIIIAPFDLFGEGKYCYSFQMKCKEVDDLWLEDGIHRIFLNTNGENPEEVSVELVELLNYFEQTNDHIAENSTNEQIKEIHKRIGEIKSSEEIGVRYMQEWEEKAYIRKEALEEGEKRLANLIKYLASNNRLDDLKRIATDDVYREELYREFEKQD